MEAQPQQVVQNFLAAVQQGNMPQVAAALHPQVQWSQPGNNRFSGLKTSREEVFQMVGGMYEVSANSLNLTKVEVVGTNGNAVACQLRWQAAHVFGSALDVDNIDVYTVEQGVITRVQVFTADAQQEDYFWKN